MEKVCKGVWIKFIRIAFTGHRPNNKYMGGYDYNSDKNRIIYSYIYNSVLKAHYNGDVPNIKIEIENLNLRTMSQLIYFFMVSAAFSALLFEVDPFNQPGVEAYKKKLLIDLGVEYEWFS